MIHLLTVNDQVKLERVREYMSKSWPNFTFVVNQSDLGYALRCEYNGTRSLKSRASDLTTAVLSHVAPAYYSGLRDAEEMTSREG